MTAAAKGPLAALLVSVVLIAVYVGVGGGSYEPMAVANPCDQRDAGVLEARGTFEAIALSALDGAACELQVSREDLTLALADENATNAFAAAHHISPDDLDAAARAGLVRAVDDAATAGKISGVEETVLRAIAERAPVGAAIAALQALPGDDSIQSLLNRLGSVTDLQLPGLDGLPSLDDLQGLIP